MEKSSKSIRQTLFSYWNIYGPFPNSNTVHIHILASDTHSCRRLILDRITLMRPKWLFLTTCNRSFRHTRNTNTNIELSSFRQIYGLCPPSHRKVYNHNSTSTSSYQSTLIHSCHSCAYLTLFFLFIFFWTSSFSSARSASPPSTRQTSLFFFFLSGSSTTFHTTCRFHLPINSELPGIPIVSDFRLLADFWFDITDFLFYHTFISTFHTLVLVWMQRTFCVDAPQ